MDNDELIKHIVQKVLEEIKLQEPASISKELLISDTANNNMKQTSFMHYDKNDTYSSIIIDYLSLEECARIIHNIRYKEKVNFIIDNIGNLSMNILNIEQDKNGLSELYQEILISYGFIFNKKQEVENKLDTINKKVLNERDIMKLDLGNTKILEISQNTIITPLAYDYLKNKKIKVIKGASYGNM